MREIFNDIYDLIGYYQFIKADITSIRTILPQKESGGNSHKYRARASQSSRESRLVFIGDVENFTKWFKGKNRFYVYMPNWCLLDVFHFTFCPAITKHKSWGQMAGMFRRKINEGELIPKRFQYRTHLWKLSKEMRKTADDYFYNKGLIIQTTRNKVVTKTINDNQSE